MKYSQSVTIGVVFFLFFLGCKSKNSDFKRELNDDICKLIENKKLDIGVSIKDYSGQELNKIPFPIDHIDRGHVFSVKIS
jgi:hypothetical protein